MAKIVQFVIDLTSTWPYHFLYFSATGCSGGMRAGLFGQAVCFSFFKLFSDFYVRSYKKAKPVDDSHATPSSSSSAAAPQISKMDSHKSS